MGTYKAKLEIHPSIGGGMQETEVSQGSWELFWSLRNSGAGRSRRWEMLSQKSSGSGEGGIRNQQVMACTSNQAFNRDLPSSQKNNNSKNTTFRVGMDVKWFDLTSVSYIWYFKCSGKNPGKVDNRRKSLHKRSSLYWAPKTKSWHELSVFDSCPIPTAQTTHDVEQVHFRSPSFPVCLSSTNGFWMFIQSQAQFLVLGNTRMDASALEEMPIF